MTTEEVKQLHPGDEVHWKDPDGGLCSRNYTIQDIMVIEGDEEDGNEGFVMVKIADVDGSNLECFPWELS